MTPRNQRKILLAVNAGLLVAVCVAITSPLWPLRQGDAPLQDRNRPTATNPASVYGVGPLAAYEATGNINLRRPLRDPPPVVAVAPRAVTPNITLLGTAVESGVGYGMFRTADGEITIAKVGEMVGSAEVIAVDEKSASVRLAGKEFVLPVQQEAKP